jgi:hypothetical protein
MAVASRRTQRKDNDMSEPQLLFIAGVPSSGKTCFCKWLEAEHKYIHIDAEIRGEIDAHGLDGAWSRSLSPPPDCTWLAEAVSKLGKPTVFNWGFPLGCLPVAEALKRAGFSSWWFEADATTARVEHIKAGKDAVSFDSQIRDIESKRAELHDLFTPQIVTTLDETGCRLPPEKVWARIRASVPRGSR